MDEDTDVSAFINNDSASRLKTWLHYAVVSGAKIRSGGKFEKNIMHPTVLTEVPANVELNSEEAFGPVVTVTPFEKWGDAIQMANNTKFGLNAGVFTKDIQRALKAAKQIQSGAGQFSQWGLRRRVKTAMFVRLTVSGIVVTAYPFLESKHIEVNNNNHIQEIMGVVHCVSDKKLWSYRIVSGSIAYRDIGNKVLLLYFFFLF